MFWLGNSMIGILFEDCREKGGRESKCTKEKYRGRMRGYWLV